MYPGVLLAGKQNKLGKYVAEKVEGLGWFWGYLRNVMLDLLISHDRAVNCKIFIETCIGELMKSIY